MMGTKKRNSNGGIIHVEVGKSPVLTALVDSANIVRRVSGNMSSSGKRAGEQNNLRWENTGETGHITQVEGWWKLMLEENRWRR